MSMTRLGLLLLWVPLLSCQASDSDAPMDPVVEQQLAVRTAAAPEAVAAEAVEIDEVDLLQGPDKLEVGAPTATCVPRSLKHLRSSEFPLPGELEDAVRFWIRVYAEWPSAQYALHDPSNLDRVYQVVTAQGYGDPALTRARAEQRKLGRRGVRAQRGLRDRFARGLWTSGRYLAEIESLLEERGLPRELVAIAFVESMFNLQAESHVGALGLWQFMPATGREYMNVNQVVDERLDPIIATRSAGRYLATAHRKLGSWPLAITSYNYGMGGVSRAVKRARTHDLARLVKRYRGKSFGFAVKNYYAEFQAARHVLMNREACFPGLGQARPWRYEQLELPTDLSAPELAARVDMSLDELSAYNPALSDAVLKGQVLLPARCRLRVAPQRKAQVQEVLAALAPPRPAEQQAPGEEKIHRVKPGENATRIASLYNLPVRVLLEANGLGWEHTLYPDMVLKVPARSYLR